MVNWYAVGLGVCVLYILPTQKIARTLYTYYKNKPVKIRRKTVVAIIDTIGINFEKTLKFANLGHKIIIGTQDESKSEKIKRDITKISGNNNIKIIFVNRNDFESLEKFAEEIIQTENYIDILINNTGNELIDLHICFSKQELAIERFKNHCTNFLKL